MLTLVLLAGLAAWRPAAAYLQNKQLESDLRNSSPVALALFRSKGFRNGAAGFFKAHELYVVPGTERAWCQDQHRGVLLPGCYVEFVFQGKGLKGTTSQGEPCGVIVRWYQQPGGSEYVPTPGAFFSSAIADDNADVVESAVYENAKPNCR